MEQRKVLTLVGGYRGQWWTTWQSWGDIVEVAGADAQQGMRKRGRGLVSGGHYLKMEGRLTFLLGWCYGGQDEGLQRL